MVFLFLVLELKIKGADEEEENDSKCLTPVCPLIRRVQIELGLPKISCLQSTVQSRFDCVQASRQFHRLVGMMTRKIQFLFVVLDLHFDKLQTVCRRYYNHSFARCDFSRFHKL